MRAVFWVMSVRGEFGLGFRRDRPLPSGPRGAENRTLAESFSTCFARSRLWILKARPREIPLDRIPGAIAAIFAIDPPFDRLLPARSVRHVLEDAPFPHTFLHGARGVQFHVSDWLVPSPGMLMGRGLMGQGVIEIHRLRLAVEAAGFDGPIEVEIFNEQLWQTPIDDAIRLIQDAYLNFV